jgi:hypothetical protein
MTRECSHFISKYNHEATLGEEQIMRKQHTILIVSIALLILAACAPVSPATDSSDADQTQPKSALNASDDLQEVEAKESGVEGQVLIGPSCPVAQSGQDCEDLPFQARITVLNPGAKEEVVANILTNEDGSFKVILEPGTYTLRPESPDASPETDNTDGPSLPASEQYPYAEELSVTVSKGEFSKVTITFDSGVR